MCLLICIIGDYPLEKILWQQSLGMLYIPDCGGDALVKLSETQVSWDAITKEIAVVPFPGPIPYQNNDGACYTGVGGGTNEENRSYVIRMFNRLVDDIGIDREVAHQAFLKIDEYSEIFDI